MGELFGRWAAVGLLGVWRRGELGLLLLVLLRRVGVVVVVGRLAGYVGGLRVLLHWDCVVLVRVVRVRFLLEETLKLEDSLRSHRKEVQSNRIKAPRDKSLSG